VDSQLYGNKIIILGSPGSGKTYFSRLLEKQTHIKAYHLDDLFWESNWQPVPEKIFLQRLLSIVKKESWIIDGNYSKYLKLRTTHADTIIFIDTPVLVCLYRIIARAMKLLFFKQSASTLPKNIIYGIKQGNTKVFDNFWGLVTFVTLFPSRDKKLVLKQILSYKNI
jgi:hypothetical protein